jgi:hypothetical protein
MTTEEGGPSVANVINGIEILDDMEVPDRQMRPSYPFGTLEPGQSFIVECDDKKHEASIRSMAVGRNRKAKDHGKEDRFIVRRIPGTETTVGVWRVS